MITADDLIRERAGRLRADLEALVAIPSISTDPGYADEVARAAAWVRDRMDAAGLDAEVHPTEGHPLVLGRHRAGPDAPTLLVYAHYDVQPPDPVDEWETAPFQAAVRDGIVRGRGVADDKAQVVLQIAAAEAALEAGELPVNLILLFEGEEEVGSGGVTAFLRERREELAADHVVIADSMMFAPDRPSLIFGMRGMAYLEIELRTGDHDLHSGQYGGAVPNPAHLLARLVASLHDPDGRVAVDGFYDEVRQVPDELRRAWSELGYDEAAFRASAGGAPLAGEAGWSTPERLWIRPCLDVNGMAAGYTGPGKKTVLPARAAAKLSCRLVPDQDPAGIAEAVRRHLEGHVPEGVRAEVRVHQLSDPWRADPDGPLYRAAAGALEEVFGTEPARVAHGGTLPIARHFADLVTPDVAVLGFALPGAHMHAPNEWIPLAQLERGARTMAGLYRRLAGGARGA